MIKEGRGGGGREGDERGNQMRTKKKNKEEKNRKREEGKRRKERRGGWSGEEAKRQTLKWFGHVERMEESKMTGRGGVSEIEGGNVRGRPPVKWRDRVQEYVRERGERSLKNFEQARRDCLDRDGNSSAVAPLMGAPRSRCQR